MWVSLALITIWAALAALMYGARWPRNLAALGFSLAAIFALSLLAFYYSRLLLDIAAPMLVVALLFVAAIVRSLEAQTLRAISYALGMRRRDALLKSVVHSSTDCILCVDEAGIIKTANPAASKLFSCATYELLDEPLAKFITVLAGEAAGARLGALHGVVRECDARTPRWRGVPGGNLRESRATQYRTPVHPPSCATSANAAFSRTGCNTRPRMIR
jgi:PAS domain-containing protein